MTDFEEFELLLNNINKRVDDIYNFLKEQNAMQDKRLNSHAEQLKELEKWKNKIIGGLLTISFILTILAGYIMLMR